MSTILYIISKTTTPNRCVAQIVGADSIDCETQANEQYGSRDYHWTYSPAFGAINFCSLADDPMLIGPDARDVPREET